MVGVESFFKETREHLCSKLREAHVDHEAFDQLIRPCELAICRATCCHDGVRLSEGDAMAIKSLVSQNEDVFREYGVELDGGVVEIVEGGRGWKTKAHGADESLLAKDFPKHFARTRCVFLDTQHRCALQRFSIDKGENPWFYKPFTCWIHPILIRQETDRMSVTLVNPENDPQQGIGYPGYGSCTHCGRPDAKGDPAKEVLSGELEALGSMVGRSFTGELNAPEADWCREIL